MLLTLSAIFSPLRYHVRYCLLSENVLAVPGSGFGLKGHFRLSYSVEDRVISGSAEAWKRAVNSYNP